MNVRSIDTILESKLADIQSRLPAGADSIFGNLLASSIEAADALELSTGQEAVDFAQQFIGTPYVFGGSNLTNGIDCSAFVQSAYKAAGIDLPRTAYQQSQMGYSVSLQALAPGDLLFFKTSDRAPITHVGMYIGDNQFIHSSSSGQGVGISTLNAKWRNVLEDTRRVTAY
jgi:cell wall-associated NlpC family hydrolase